MRGWDAESACQAINKTMISLDELVVEWDGKEWINELSPLAQKLYADAFNGNGEPLIWTSNKQGNHSLYMVHLSDGQVSSNCLGCGYNGWNYDSFAVCK